MPIATLTYTLPDESMEFRAAQAGVNALITLEAINQRLRAILKHGEPYERSGETGQLAHEIRGMIPYELLEILE